jgi:cytochrome c biogenesis protein CcmG, thiol:disulfide interchange protein DsbE
MRTWIAIAGLACLTLVVVLYRAFGTDPHEVPFMLQGKPAPPFAVTDLMTGQPVTSEQLKGQPYVLNFWASWCEPCEAEHPTIEWGARTFSDRARFFGVLYSDTAENAKKNLAHRSVSFPQLLDPHSRMGVDFATTGVPETYFIDASGIIVHKYVGPIDRRTLAYFVEQIAPSRAEARP